MMVSLTPPLRLAVPDQSDDNPTATDADRRQPRPVSGVAAESAVGRIELSWAHVDWDPLLDHYAVYGSRDGAPEIADETLLDKTVYSHFFHTGLPPQAQTWTYRVLVVDAAGQPSDPSPPVSATSTESVVIDGDPVAEAGTFDGKSFELALAPDGFPNYPDRFPDGVDFTAGVDTAGDDWCYIHPGPNDAWAGNTAHTFTLRFDLDEISDRDLVLAIWLIDAHAINPGTAVVGLNGHIIDEVSIQAGSTRGGELGDSTGEDSPLRPSYEELTLPPEGLTPGQNSITLDKVDGSFHVYDAIGVFLTS